MILIEKISGLPYVLIFIAVIKIVFAPVLIFCFDSIPCSCILYTTGPIYKWLHLEDYTLME